MGVLGGVFVLNSGLRILIQAPEVPFSVPPKQPKTPKMTHFGRFRGVLWVILWGSPLFLAISGLCHFAIITTLNFGPWTTKLGETVGAIKKMTHNDNGHGPGRN